MLLSVLIKQKMKLQCQDLSPAQKKVLWEVMSRYGATQGFSYRRFFKEGFKEWEMQGVERVKNNFIHLHPQISDLMKSKHIKFYRAVVESGLRKLFLSYMSELGMSMSQVYEKFKKKEEITFLDYEKVGIIAIYREFMDEVHRRKMI